MPTINLDRAEVERLAGRKLPEEKLKDRISMLGTDLESVTSKEIIVEVFPNRPDMLSEQGFGRAFSAFIGGKTGLREYCVKRSGERVIIEASVKEVRPYTACAIVKNLILDDKRIKQIMQLQEKLHVTFGRNRKKAAIGVYPLERIKMPIYFRGINPKEIKFRPLEYNKELNGLEILELHPKGREFAQLLRGKKVFPYFIDAAGKVLSMPPIINSEDTGKVDAGTREVFIECSGFDFKVLKQCLNILVTALADIGGEVYSMEIIDKKKEVTPCLKPWKLKLSLDYVNKVLGLSLKENEIKKLLAKMGLGYEKKQAVIPAYRADILHQVDVIEDIAIAYGYENFKEEIPRISTIASENKARLLREKIGEVLVGLGLIETASYSLSNKACDKKSLLNNELIELENALNQDYSCLRGSLIPGMLRVFSENKHNDYPQRVFEIGAVFSKGDGETGVCEKNSLCVGITGVNANFTEVKGVLDGMSRVLGIDYSLKDEALSCFIVGRCGRIIVNGKPIGVIGEVNPEALVNFKLDYPAVIFELNPDLMLKELKELKTK